MLQTTIIKLLTTTTTANYDELYSFMTKVSRLILCYKKVLELSVINLNVCVYLFLSTCFVFLNKYDTDRASLAMQTG